MTFGEYLRVMRMRAKLSLVKLSELLGKSFGHLSKIEQGERPPPDDDTSLAAWAKAIGAPERPFRIWAQITRGSVSVQLPDGDRDVLQKYVQIINTVPHWSPSDMERVWKFLMKEELLHDVVDVTRMAEDCARGVASVAEDRARGVRSLSGCSISGAGDVRELSGEA